MEGMADRKAFAYWLTTFFNTRNRTITNHTVMPEFGKIEELTENLKKYIATSYELQKLQAIESSSVFGSGLISSLLVGLVVVLFVFFLSLWAGFYLSASIGDNYSGFLIVAGFYFLFGFILILVRKKLIERPLQDKIIRKVFSNN